MEQQPAAADACEPDLCASTDLLVRFVNTRPSRGGRPELLADRVPLAGWLSGAGIADRDVPVSDADAAAARELREALVTIFRFHTGCLDAPVSDAEAYLQYTAERYPLTLKLSAGGGTLVPAQTGIPGAFGALLAAAGDAAARGAWARLKICKNTSCHGGFFDKTRNSAGLYCSTACNSQMSMRAYRTRLKNEAAAPSVRPGRGR